MAEKNLYVGCGEDVRGGYMHCDIRSFPHVDFVCKAWEVSKHIKGLNNIYSRHMLEHLTSAEAVLALKDWFKALKIGGSVYIVVPNLDFHCEQWLRAKWNDEELENWQSDASWGLGGLYGWQRECDPEKEEYNTSYWDVHKTGFNEKRMIYLLEKIGFTNIKITIKNDVHLVAEATKETK